MLVLQATRERGSGVDADDPVRCALGILAPLALYLISPMTIPAMMWWTATLNQVCVQTTFFLAVGATVRYLRGDGLAGCSSPYAAVAFGLLFDVKALLILARHRVRRGRVLRRRAVRSPGCAGTVRRYWPAAILIAEPLVGGYVAYYTTTRQRPFAERPGRVARRGRQHDRHRLRLGR